MTTEHQDKRLRERSARANPGASKAAAELPDLVAEVEAPAAEALDDLRRELTDEHAAREERIARFAEERAAPPPPRPPVQPLNESEL